MRTRHHTSGDRTGNLPPPTGPIRIWTSSQTTGWASPLSPLRPMRIWLLPPGDRTGILPPPHRPMRTRHHPSGDRTGTLPASLCPMRIWILLQATVRAFLSHHTTPYADLAPPPRRPYGRSLPHHIALCGSGPSPQTTVRAFSPSPHRPMRIWTSSQTTVRADYHQCHHNPLPSSGEQHIRSQT